MNTDNLAAAQQGIEIDDKASSLAHVLKEREEHILGLYAELSARGAQLIEVYGRLGVCERDLARTANYENEIVQLRRSTSWRVTRPLRLVSTFAQGLKKGMGPAGAWRTAQAFCSVIGKTLHLPSRVVAMWRAVSTPSGCASTTR